MTEFGPDGAVLRQDQAEPARDYANREKPRIRHVLLACFLCGIAASISVAIIAAIMAFVFSTVTASLGLAPFDMSDDDGFLSGAFIAVMMAAFNWYLFYIVVPVTWVVLICSIGRFPRRGIVRHTPYYRWGGIWGAMLVGGTTGIVGANLGTGGGWGAFVTGLGIGALAGVICASLFLAIVRPQKHIGLLETEVF